MSIESIIRNAANQHAIIVCRQLGGKTASKIADSAEKAGVDLAALRTGRVKDAFLPIANKISPLLGRYLDKGQIEDIFPLPNYDEFEEAYQKDWQPPTGTPLLTLGNFVFSVGTAAHQTLERVKNWQWASLDRINAVPLSQFMGTGEETITISGYILPEFAGGFYQLERMREIGDLAQPQHLFDGYGEYLGDWVILSVRENGGSYNAAGQPLRMDFTINLRAFPEDGLFSTNENGENKEINTKNTGAR